MDTTQQFKKAYDYSKQNPNTEFATELRKRIEAGQYDNELRATGIKPNGYTLKPTEEPGLLGRIGSDIKTRFQNASANIQGTAPESQSEPGVTRGVQAAANVAGVVGDTLRETAKSIGNLLPSRDPNKPVTPLERPNVFQIVSDVGQKLAGNQSMNPTDINAIGKSALGVDLNPTDKFIESFNSWAAAHPEAAKNLETVLKTAKGTGVIANNLLAVEGGAQIAKASAQGAISGAKSVAAGLNEAENTLVGKINAATTTPVTAEKQALDLVRKPQTSAYQKLAAEEGRFVQEPGLLGKRTIVPDATEKAMAEAVKPLVEQGKLSPKLSIIEQQKVIDDEARALNAQLKSELNNPANNKQINRADLESRFDDLKSNRDIELQSEPAAERAYNAVVKKFKSFVQTDDTSGLFEARQRFDAYMRKNYPGAFRRSGTGDLTPTNNAINSAFYDIRNSVNDIIGDALPSYKPTLLRESGLINAADNIGYRELVGTSNSNKFTRLFAGKSTKDKLIQAAIIGGAGAVAGGVGTGVIKAASGK